MTFNRRQISCKWSTRTSNADGWPLSRHVTMLEPFSDVWSMPWSTARPVRCASFIKGRYTSGGADGQRPPIELKWRFLLRRFVRSSGHQKWTCRASAVLSCDMRLTSIRPNGSASNVKMNDSRWRWISEKMAKFDGNHRICSTNDSVATLQHPLQLRLVTHHQVD